MPRDHKCAVVLFSGGVDSVYVATKIAQRYDRIALNTYRVPGMVWTERSVGSARQLEKLYPGKIEHNIIDIRDRILRMRGGARQCLRDNFSYHFFYAWCLGCKLGMHLATRDFCLAGGTTHVFDGSNAYDVHSLEQHEDAKEVFNEEVYEAHGLVFESPNYYEDGLSTEMTTYEKLLAHLVIYMPSHNPRAAHIASLGIDMGSKVGHQYRRCQPSCTTSLAFNGTRLFYKALLGEKPKGYLRYIRDKIERW